VNRWYASSLGVLVVGLLLALLVVPYDDGSCPTVGTVSGAGCRAYGSVPRIATLIVTAIVALVLATIGSVGTSSRRPG
jgi:hypothetical protein